MKPMPDWDFDANNDANRVLSLRRTLIALRSVLQAKLPMLMPEYLDRPRDYSLLQAEFRVAIERNFWGEARPPLELIDDISRMVEASNNVDDRSGSTDTAARRRPESPQTFVAASVFAGRKMIHLGFVDRYLVYPVSPPLNDLLLHMVLEIPGVHDLLIRENHTVFGWHYHYCDHDKRRSDTIMSFDQRRDDRTSSVSTRAPVPLCWEPHSINKAKFKAKPRKWGETKRKSIYAACATDLAIRPPLFFKPPSQEAEDVWPQRTLLPQTERPRL